MKFATKPNHTVTLALILQFLLSASITLSAQEQRVFVKKNNRITTEYQALNRKKSSRHGYFIKYVRNAEDEVSLIESGSYKHGVADGVWEYYFAGNWPSNLLKDIGRIKSGYREGVWFEYYPSIVFPDSMRYIDANDFRLEIPAVNSIMASGSYRQNKKVGVWTYYSNDGHPAGQYDFDQDKSIITDSSAQLLGKPVYVGGIDRLYFEVLDRLDFIANPFLFSNVHVDSPSSIELALYVNPAGRLENVSIVNSTLPDDFRKRVVKIVYGIPNQWYPPDLSGHSEPQSLSLILQFEFENSPFGRHISSIDLFLD